MEAKKVQDIKNGEFVKRKEHAKKVYIKDSYDRTIKRYILVNAEDYCSSILVKKDTLLYIGSILTNI
ncbi:MAG: hypothetical protein V3W20_03765 [Candidatus Neomarinimicrobiota bacterium]